MNAAVICQSGWYSIITILIVTAVLIALIWIASKRLKRPSITSNTAYVEALNLILAGRLTEAARSLSAALSEDRENYDAYIKLGSVYRRLDKPKQAVQILLELTARPKLPKAVKSKVYQELALDYEQLEDSENALRYIDDAIHTDPSDSQHIEIKLRLLEGLERWSEAGQILEKEKTKRDNGNTSRLAMYKLREGEALCRQGQEHNGRTAFKAAIRIDPSISEAQLFTADSYIRESKPEEALKWISIFLSEHPDRGELAIPMLEGLLFETGRFDEIEPIIRDTVDKAPDNRRLTLILIDLLTKKGEVDEALELCAQILDSVQSDLVTRVYRLQLLRRKDEDKTFDRELDELLALVAPLGRGFYCRDCGQHSDRLISRCPNCGKWRSFFGERRRPHTSEKK